MKSSNYSTNKINHEVNMLNSYVRAESRPKFANNMTISKTQIKNNRIQGIHFSEIGEKDKDLVYNFSNFYTNGLTAAVDQVKTTPLVGTDASDMGTKLYLRGTTWDANHMDRFINSSVNKRLSYKKD